MRPTVKDLAKAAGVSLATVDRVLNDRPNVSKKSARKVSEAIERIGFTRNLAAANLAKNKTYRFRFVLPDTGDQYLEALLRQVEEANRTHASDHVVVDIAQIGVGDPHGVANYLATLEPDRLDGVAIMAPESPQVRDAMVRLNERGIKLVQFLSGQEKLDNTDFVGIDNFAAGATAGRIIGQFHRQQQGQVLIIAETIQAQDSIERRIGFDRIINEKFPHLEVLPSLETYADPARAKRIIERSFQFNKDIIAVYVLSSEARIPIKAVSECADLESLCAVAHERTPFTEEAIRAEQLKAIICQDPGHAVRSAIRIMRARTDQREPVLSQEKIRIEVLFRENL
ncbi:MAG: LacI family DNA-binding transcriptional regulator [Hyphomicrobiales bacterium]